VLQFYYIIIIIRNDSKNTGYKDMYSPEYHIGTEPVIILVDKQVSYKVVYCTIISLKNVDCKLNFKYLWSKNPKAIDTASE